MNISYSLHSLDCNLDDGEYVLIPEQGAVHEEDQEQAPETAIEDLPAAPAIEMDTSMLGRVAALLIRISVDVE
jgi:hypothetical protein